LGTAFDLTGVKTLGQHIASPGDLEDQRERRPSAHAAGFPHDADERHDMPFALEMKSLTDMRLEMLGLKQGGLR
jgi:hypothetical protein